MATGLTSSSTRQSGFGALAIIIVIAVVALVAVAGVVVYKRSDSKNGAVTLPSSNSSGQQPMASPPPQTADPYEGMTKYVNDKYGISFYYPSEWRVEERDPQLTADPEKTQLSLWLVDTTAEANQSVAVVKVVDRDLSEVGPAGDGDLSQYKQQLTIKGKQAVRYSIPQSASVNRDMYFIAVGTKTYSISSIEESDNITRTPDYMEKFNKLVDSLILP